MKTPKVIRITSWGAQPFPEFGGTYLHFCKQCKMPAHKHPGDRCLFVPFPADYAETSYVWVHDKLYSLGDNVHYDWGQPIYFRGLHYMGDLNELRDLGIKIDDI